jgi:hypothetical protein
MNLPSAFNIKNTPFLIHDLHAINIHCNVRLTSGGISTMYENTMHCQYAASYVNSITHYKIVICKFIYLVYLYCLYSSFLSTHYIKLKVELTLEQAMLAQTGSRGLFSLDRGGLSPPNPGCFTHCIGFWVGPRAQLDGVWKMSPHRGLIPGPSSYTN